MNNNCSISQQQCSLHIYLLIALLVMDIHSDLLKVGIIWYVVQDQMPWYSQGTTYIHLIHETYNAESFQRQEKSTLMLRTLVYKQIGIQSYLFFLQLNE